MHPIFPLFENHADQIGEQVVIRLIGPDRHGIEERTGNKWNAIVDPKDEELDCLVSLLHRLMSRDVEIYLNVNNHYEGSAPLTIQRIRERLAGSENALSS